MAKVSHSRRAAGSLLEMLERRRLFSAPALPVIPAGTFDITAYGATANDSTDDTAAIQAAINACHNSANGGGTVQIPAGTFLSGPITLFSSMNLNLADGAILRMLPYGTYPLPSGATAYPNFITAEQQHDVKISGSGNFVAGSIGAPSGSGIID